MPRRGSPSPRDYYHPDYNRSGSRTPRGPGSVASYSSYDSEDEEGPTLFGGILRTMAARRSSPSRSWCVAPLHDPTDRVDGSTRGSAAFASAFARLDPRARASPTPPRRISFPPSTFAPPDETRRPKTPR